MQLTIEEFEAIGQSIERALYRQRDEFYHQIDRAESRAKVAEEKLEAIEKSLRISPKPHGSRSSTWMNCGTDDCSVRVPLQNWKACVDEGNELIELRARVKELESDAAQTAEFKWSETAPIEPGLYWYKMGISAKTTVIELATDGLFYFLGSALHHTANIGGFWGGQIALPQIPNEEDGNE